MKAVDQSPALSVIVPTYQGAHRILITLSSLARQRFTDFEVIVVIDGSTDNTTQVIADANLDINIHVYQQENSGRSGSRNAGAALANAQHLVFFDDDVEIPENVLEEYSRMIHKNTIVAGAFYPVYRIKSEFSRYASYLNDRWTNNLPVKRIMESPYLSAANFFIERNLFEQEGGFNTKLPDAEDLDLAIRLFEKGNAIYFNPDIKVGHAIQETFMEYASRTLQYKQAQRILLAENLQAIKYVTKNEKVKGIKAVMYKFFSYRVYIRFMDAGFFRILPQHFRFRLYNLILTAYSQTNSK